MHTSPAHARPAPVSCPHQTAPEPCAEPLSSPACPHTRAPRPQWTPSCCWLGPPCLPPTPGTWRDRRVWGVERGRGERRGAGHAWLVGRVGRGEGRVLGMCFGRQGSMVSGLGSQPMCHRLGHMVSHGLHIVSHGLTHGVTWADTWANTWAHSMTTDEQEGLGDMCVVCMHVASLPPPPHPVTPQHI